MSLLVSVQRGAQDPLFRSVPPVRSSAGVEAVELAASAGLVLDPAQAAVLEAGLGEREDGSWAAFEVCLVEPRQNGKGAILEALELAGLFLFGEELILHSAHEFKTAADAFRRVLEKIQGCHDLDKLVSRVRTSHGDEGVELKGGQRLRFVARSSGSGRGFSADRIILDEAYNLPAKAVAALLPTMSARPNPQLWYTSSAPLAGSESDTLRRLCKRGRAASRGDREEARLAYFEWSALVDAPPGDYDAWQAEVARLVDDRTAWAQANHALGGRITEEAVESERAAMDWPDFARERLGIFPEESHVVSRVISADAWEKCQSTESAAEDPVVFAFEVSHDRQWAVIGSAGVSTVGGKHVEVVDNRARTGWVVDRLVQLRDKHQPSDIVCHASGPAGSLLADCEKAGLKVRELSTAHYAKACGAAFDEITEGRWRHPDQRLLNIAAAGATRRPMGDAWVFDRRGSTDISPLAAVCLAGWALGEPDSSEPILIVT